MNPQYPNVTVELVGQDGNAFSILGRVIRAMRKGKVPQADISKFQEEAMSGDYENLLRTVCNWVNVE